MLPTYDIRGKIPLAAVLFISIIGCGASDQFRGHLTESPDGRTYLAIVDDNNGCDIKVDGQPWRAALGAAQPIQSGKHIIECRDGKIHFIVPEGVVFNFDYWGP